MKGVRIRVIRTDKPKVMKGTETVLVFALNKGFSYLAEIIHNPQQIISNHLLAAERSSLRTIPEEYYVHDERTGMRQIDDSLSIGYIEEGVELTDKETVRQCMERVNRLNTKLAVLKTCEPQNDNLIGETQAEIRAISDYLRRTYIPARRKSRKTRTGTEKIALSVYMAIYRALALIDTEDKATAALLRAVVKVNHTHSVYTPRVNITIEVTFIENSPS